jgi:phosphopentomutase
MKWKKIVAKVIVENPQLKITRAISNWFVNSNNKNFMVLYQCGLDFAHSPKV